MDLAALAKYYHQFYCILYTYFYDQLSTNGVYLLVHLLQCYKEKTLSKSIT